MLQGSGVVQITDGSPCLGLKGRMVRWLNLVEWSVVVFVMGADLPWRDHGKGLLVLQHHPAPKKTLLKRIPRPTFRKKGESRSPKKKAAVQFFVEDVGVLSLGARGQGVSPVGSWGKDSPSLPDMCTSMCTWHVLETCCRWEPFFFSF